MTTIATHIEPATVENNLSAAFARGQLIHYGACDIDKTLESDNIVNVSERETPTY